MSLRRPAPPALEILETRARILDATRRFFRLRGYLEVDTPILGPTASMEPHLVSFETEARGPDGGSPTPLYLQTSPEYAMKRLLGAHGRSIFQIARVFRNEEASRTHHHEFSMLEWYRVGADYRTLMDETEALVRALCLDHGQSRPRLRRIAPGGEPEGELDTTLAFERLTVREAFARYAGLDPWQHDDAASFATAARATGCDADDDWPWEDIFHLVLLERVEPRLGHGRATFLIDYPPRLAALSRLRHEPDGHAVAERFELYACGLELCNGFSELVDAAEQRARFEAEQAERARLGRPVPAIDEALLEALGRCPPCSGNALGLDRLILLLCEKAELGEVLVR